MTLRCLDSGNLIGVAVVGMPVVRGIDRTEEYIGRGSVILQNLFAYFEKIAQLRGHLNLGS